MRSGREGKGFLIPHNFGDLVVTVHKYHRGPVVGQFILLHQAKSYDHHQIPGMEQACGRPVQADVAALAGDRIIDDGEQAVLALNKEAIRAAIVGYLEELSKKSPRCGRN